MSSTIKVAWMGPSKIMNKETQRIIVASVLITLVAYFYPNFWYVDNNEPNIDNNAIEQNNKTELLNLDPQSNANSNIKKINNKNYENQIITIINKLYNTTISNQSGGTIISSEMVEKNKNNFKYIQKSPSNLGSIDYSAKNTILESDDDDSPVILNGGICNPCIGYYDSDINDYQYINSAFKIITPNIQSEYILNEDDSLVIDFQYNWHDMIINKTVTFYGDTYETRHDYHVKNPINNKLEIIWSGGLKPIDQEDFDWISGNAMIGQSGETESIKITDSA